jgi:hypothetical protein
MTLQSCSRLGIYAILKLTPGETAKNPTPPRHQPITNRKFPVLDNSLSWLQEFNLGEMPLR